MTERRQIGETVHYDFHDRSGHWVSASAFFLRERVYELVWSGEPHWLAESKQFDFIKGSDYANHDGESPAFGLGAFK